MFNFFSFPLPATVVRILLAISLLASCLPAAAQTPNWQSAQAVALATTAGSFSEVTATAVDASGNVYLVGYFTNTVVLGGTTLTSLGSFDVFVAKFNPASNQFVWAQRAGGTGVDEATAVIVNGTSVYVAGYFASTTADFGSTTLTKMGTGAAIADMFVTKLTDAGSTASFAWAQRGGGTNDDRATAVSVSGSSVYVAGYFASATAGFGTTNLLNAGSNGADLFVTKLTDAGTTASFAWAQRAGGTSNDYATAMAVSGTSIYVTGDFDGTANFGSISLTPNGLGRTDVFVAKLTDAGSTSNFIWARRAGGSNYDNSAALAVSGTSIFIAGNFTGIADFGSINLTTGAFTAEVFVAKLTDTGSAGSFVWAQQAGGTANDQATALSVSGASVYVAGWFTSPTATFGATSLNNPSIGSEDVFVAKLTDAGSTGSFAWAQRGGSRTNERAAALVRSGTVLYVAGYFAGTTADFGTITLNNPTGGYLGFLASLADPTLTATATGHTLAPAQLFPNPARRMVALRLPAGAASAPLTLTDVQGRTVRHYPAPTGPDTALDLLGLPAGLYLLRGTGPAQRLVVE